MTTSMVRKDTHRITRLNHWVFALWWFALLLLHAVNLVYYVAVAFLYQSVRGTFLEFQLQIYNIGISKAHYHSIVGIHACVATVHGFLILFMVASSVHARKFMFYPEMQVVHRILDRYPGIKKLFLRWHIFSFEQTDDAKSTSRPSLQSFTSRAVDSFSRANKFIFARDGILGVDSVFFDQIHLAREFAETALQTYQLYRMTQVLPRLWLIRFYVALLVANCWIVPILHWSYRDSKVTRRELSLLCDAVLDVLSSIGVSIIIVITYAPQYSGDSFGFAFDVWYDDDWFTNMQQEFQMMLVASWTDMISRLIFAIGLLQCVNSIKDMLEPQQEFAVAPTRGPDASAASRKVLPVITDDGPTQNLQHESKSHHLNKQSTRRRSVQPTRSRLAHFLIHVFGPSLFLVWGLAVLTLQLAAESYNTDAPCSHRLKPWLSTKPGCSLLAIDCSLLLSNGNDGLFEKAWDAFNNDYTTRVAIRHCPQLNMSQKIKLLTSITDVKLYNATIDSWSNDAALTSTHHADLRAVFLIRTDFPNGLLPEGLTPSNFPKTVVNFMVCISNLTTLPTDLDSKWPFFVQLNFEYTKLTKIEDVIMRLFPLSISMAGSPVSEVPVAALELPSLVFLMVGRTRIQELPRNVTYLSPQLLSMSVQETGISTLWSWMDCLRDVLAQSRATAFNAGGTPYCHELEEIAAKKRTAFTHANDPDAGIMMDTSTPEKLAFVLRIVDCSSDHPLTYFPVLVEDAKHSLQH